MVESSMVGKHGSRLQAWQSEQEAESSHLQTQAQCKRFNCDVLPVVSPHPLTLIQTTEAQGPIPELMAQTFIIQSTTHSTGEHGSIPRKLTWTHTHIHTCCSLPLLFAFPSPRDSNSVVLSCDIHKNTRGAYYNFTSSGVVNLDRVQASVDSTDNPDGGGMQT